MSRRVTPFRVVGAVLAAALLAIYILYRIPSGEYVFLPDPAHPVAPLVQVQGAHPAKGGGSIYFVDVREQRASELEHLFPWLHDHATYVPAQEIVPPGATDAAVQAAQLREMALSQQIAAAVALRRLGYRVPIRPNGVLVNVVDLGVPAAAKLESADVIVGVDGSPTPTIPRLRRLLGRVRPGALVALRVRRGARLLTIRVRTVRDPQEPGRAIVGFEPAQAAQITLPIHVSIDAHGIGGPSAGLAFALEVMRKLGRDVTHGYKVAATGEMELDGTVAPIGGVEQKTYGVRAAGADVFLVPAGDNARVARRYAGPVRIVPVRSFAQALHALATLPPVR